MLYKNKNILRRNGFTLVELLVVIAIMGIFLVISIPNYGAYTRALAVKGSAKDIRSILWEAQALSLGPKDDLAESYHVEIGKSLTRFDLKQVPESANITSFVVPNRAVSIKEILVDGIAIPGDAKVSVVFDTGLDSGKSQDAGKITFLDDAGAEIAGTRMKITLFSSISDVEYRVVIDRNLGSIVVSINQ